MPSGGFAYGVTPLLQWIFRGSIWAFTGRIAFGLFVILQNAALARLFASDELGIYLLFQSLVLPTVVVAVFGTDLLVVRTIGELRVRDRLDEVRDILRDCSLVVCIMGLAGSAILMATLSLGCSDNWITCQRAAELNALVVPLVLLSAMQLQFAGAFRGWGQIGLATVSTGVLSNFLLLACLAAALLTQLSLDLVDVVLLQIGSIAIGVLLAGTVIAQRVFCSGTRGRLAIRPVLGAGMSLMTTQILALIVTQSDLWIVSGFATPDVVAAYGLASRLAQLVSLPHLVLNSVLPPLIATMMPRADCTRLERITQLLVSAAVLPAFSLFLAFMFTGRPLLGMLFGPSYENAWTYLIVLSLGNLVNVAAGVCSQALIIAGQQFALLWITLGSCCSCIIIAMIAAHFWGAIGVAVAYAIGLGFQGIVSASAALRLAGMRTYASPRLLLREVGSKLWREKAM